VSTDDREVLVREASDLVRSKAQQMVRRRLVAPQDQEDVRQALLLHVLRKARGFDPSKTSRERFLTMIVRQAVANLLRDRAAGKRCGHAQSLSRRVRTADGPVELVRYLTDRDGQARLGTSSRDAAEQAQLATDVAQVVAGLPAPLRELAARLSRQTKASAARELGRGEVEVGVRRLRRAFERAGLKKYLENT
jgi:RNA polymerase sigma-70 factor (ECF subfamily)